ncbi:unnamed protein product [Penicillium olsonii]|uniref:Fungal N-terminal domain-containing protein n=1 Tax=Penicillium olsonii TaxID=99116 RepID=A0A9W4HBJ7_PENOL|nr:unnamed protein product [Penicillium olsonii]CAG7975840.1 unnamed protein product [Penicillium olsonii]
MSDPLSVAGSAVGIISLGLQVCGEIVSYCQAWRGFDEDIQRITEKADGLCMPLKGLREIIEYAQRNSHAEASDLESKTQSLQQAILRLKSATDRCASTGSITPNGIRYQLKKATYPFKKDGLREISTDLDSIQMLLHTTLHIYSIQNLRDMQETISQQMQDINSKIMGQSIPFMAPSRLRQLCDQQSIQQAIEPCLHVTEQNNSLKSLNRAPSRSYQSHGRTDCISRSGLRFASKSEPKSSKEYRYSMYLLGFVFQASLRFDRGAGGISIAPLLHMQPLLSEESSVGCKLLNGHEFLLWLTPDLDDYERSIDLIISRLQKAFDRREASPLDRVWVHSEVSIFDVSLFPYINIRFCPPVDPLEQIAFKMLSFYRPIRDPIWFSHTSRLLNFLLDCGSWIQGNNSQVENVMSLSPNTSFGKEGSLGLRLLELGYPFQLRDPQSLIEKRELRYLISHHYDYVARIIILESESELRYMMESRLVSPNYREDQWSLLGLSFGWPQGLQILLQAGADASGNHIRFVEDTPKGETYESVKLMLEAGCRIEYSAIWECQKVKNGGRIQSLLIQELATRIRKLWDLAQIHLPLHELPNLITHETVTDKSYIFDVHVPETLAKLEAQGTEIGPQIVTPHSDCFIPVSGSCFSHAIFSARTLENFYRHGFRGLNEFDKSGLAPLQRSFCFLLAGETSFWKLELDRIRWLVSRGALVHLTVPGTNASIAHHIGVGATELLIQTVLLHPQQNLNKRFRLWKQALLQGGEGWFLVPSITDQCRCPCSPRGCTTLSVVLRHILRRSKSCDFKAAFSGTDGRELTQFLIEASKMTPAVHEEFIRCLTFDALDLKHACCIETGFDLYPKPKSREEEEIEEIIDEQKLRLIDFEKLVIEFQAKFDEIALPIIEFLEGYWYNRMVEYLRQRDSYDEKHFIGSKRIGVNLIQDEEFSPSGMLSLIGSFNRVVDTEVPSMIE